MLSQSPDIACHKCDKPYCCRNQQSIQISTVEFEQIKHTITEEQAKRAKHEIDNPRIMYGKRVYTCPFNDQVSGKCEIYDYRFVVCASHGVLGADSEVCNTEGSNKGTMIINPLNTFRIAIEGSEQTEAYLGYISSNGEATDILEEFKKIL